HSKTLNSTNAFLLFGSMLANALKQLTTLKSDHPAPCAGLPRTAGQPAGRRRDGKRLSGRKRLIFYGIPLSYQREYITSIEVIRNLKSQAPNIKENRTFQYPMTQTGLSFGILVIVICLLFVI
ncbi:MAG: hypothetical protein WBM78_01685, partial [Desulfobacterales bacterium]